MRDGDRCPSCGGPYQIMIGRIDHRGLCPELPPEVLERRRRTHKPLDPTKDADADRIDAELRGGLQPKPGVCSTHLEAEPCDVCLTIADERWASR